MNLQPGTLLQGGKYKIEKVLGQGGFGITYLTTMQVEVKGPLGMIKTKIYVAVKEFFIKELCNRNEETFHISVPSVGSKEQVESYRKKFKKEAENLSKLVHPNIVKVLDVFDENDTSYYVMEYIEGGSLQQYIQQSGALPEAKAINYIRQLASALEYMHGHRICHLDLKPGNILMSNDKQQVMLIDFGLSKQYDNNGNQTSSTPIGISEGYAPMEQYEPSGVSEFSPATDIYSLGAIFFFLLSGIKPPQANLVLNDGLPEPPTAVSKWTWKAIEKAMHPRRKDRPQSVNIFLELFDNEYTKEEILISYNTSDNDEKTTYIKPLENSRKKPNEELTTNQKQINRNKWIMTGGIVLIGVIILIYLLPSKTGRGESGYKVPLDSTSMKDSINNEKEQTEYTVKPEAETEVNQKVEPKKESKAKQKVEQKAELKTNPKVESKEEEKQPVAVEREASEIEKKENEEKIFKEKEADKYHYSATQYAKNKDYKKALELFEKSAELGDVRSQYMVANYSQYGTGGIPKDIKKAIYWYEKADAQNNALASYQLAMLYYDGTDVSQDYQKTLVYLHRGARLNRPDCMLTLGLCYQHGYGGEKDLSIATTWYKKGIEIYMQRAEKGDPDGYYQVAVCYYYGNGVNVDKTKAKELFQKAADMGYYPAKQALKGYFN